MQNLDIPLASRNYRLSPYPVLVQNPSASHVKLRQVKPRKVELRQEGLKLDKSDMGAKMTLQDTAHTAKVSYAEHQPACGNTAFACAC
jgi:hypothetical protein